MKRRQEVDKPVDKPTLAAGVATFALERAVAFGMTAVAALLLAFAALMLSIAWHVGPEVVARHAQYAKLTSAAPATIVDSWLALDVDIPTIRVPHNWRASTNATPCMVVELPGEWGSARMRAFCGNRFRFNESYDVPFLHELAPGAPFMWTRDERGFASRKSECRAAQWRGSARTRPTRSCIASGRPGMRSTGCASRWTGQSTQRSRDGRAAKGRSTWSTGLATLLPSCRRNSCGNDRRCRRRG